ncbi:hypothetical protein [Paracoccus litorisediminis]|uniref:Uncharacterized protein n=1 Tax=Paracoccus litorisediminis TaxID=2006130 RepID=A0A844HUC5_9RHOB|nr:hypothetical protein [Paracoccus litorisediminis]MTH61112.1 hypothetical protein [Paracoccus litorisediminis]
MTLALTMDEQKTLVQELVTHFNRIDCAHEIDGPLMSTVKREDGTYRNYEISRADFWLTGMRFGETGKPLLIFEPEDDDERYKLLEVSLAKIDTFFPTFSVKLAEFCKLKVADRELFTEDQSDLLLHVIEAIEDTEALLDLLNKALLERRAVDEAAETEKMKANPMFGMF